MANTTVNRPSKSLMQRLASSRVVLWALATHGPRLAEIFNGPLGRMLPEGLLANLDQHLAQLREVLSAARDLMIERDRANRDQRAKASACRRVRDDAFKKLNPHVMGLRDTFKGACGPDVVADLGFALRTPFQPAELYEQASHLVVRLAEPGLELPVIRYQGVDLDPPSVAEEMRPLVEDLGLALEDLGRDERQVDATKVAKDEALRAYNFSFQWAASSAESLFKLAGLPEIAKRVRPSGRRPGVTDEVESQGPDFPTGDPTDDAEDETDSGPVDDAPAGDVPETSPKARPDIPPSGDSSS